jgi:hypothetical protein
MTTVKTLVKLCDAIPITELPIIIWPVEDTGRNSVSPSIIARMIAWIKFIS